MVEIKKVWYETHNGQKTTLVEFLFDDGLKSFTNRLEFRGHITDIEKLVKIIEKVGEDYGRG